MNGPPVLKKPKIEHTGEDEQDEESNGGVTVDMANDAVTASEREEQEEALVALIEHRTNEVEHLRKRIAYYKSQLDESEKKLEGTQIKLARLRRRGSVTPSNNSSGNGLKNARGEHRSNSPVKMGENSFHDQHQSATQLGRDNVDSSKNPWADGLKDVKVEQRATSTLKISEGSRNHPQSKPQLVIPAVNPKSSSPMKMVEFGSKASSESVSRASTSVPAQANKLKGSRLSSELEDVEVQAKGTKRKFEQSEHRDLIPMVCSSNSARTIHCQTACLISSQHKRKLRSLALCPTNDQLFVTSALDGVVNLWQIQGRGYVQQLASE